MSTSLLVGREWLPNCACTALPLNTLGEYFFGLLTSFRFHFSFLPYFKYLPKVTVFCGSLTLVFFGGCLESSSHPHSCFIFVCS